MSRKEMTGAGWQLRALRERAGLSQFAVEVEAALGSGYLQRVERGKVVQPARGTLERVLAALRAHYDERREILELFGYSVDTPLPNAEERAWAMRVCHDELHGVGFPAYTVDCAQRVLAWNRIAPSLFGLDARGAARWLSDTTLLELWFAEESPAARMLHAPELFYPQAARALQHELRAYRREAWCAALIAGGLRELPLFRRYWPGAAQEQANSAARALVPYQLRSLGGSALLFRVSSEPFTRDARFRSVYFLPADASTMQWCADQ